MAEPEDITELVDAATHPEKGAVEVDHQPSEITYDEQRYPARPRRLRPIARRLLRTLIPAEAAEVRPTARNETYVEWLIDQSMLRDANQLASQLSGQGSMWQNPFAHPD